MNVLKLVESRRATFKKKGSRYQRAVRCGGGGGGGPDGVEAKRDNVNVQLIIPIPD